MTVVKTVDAELDRDLRLETLAIEANEAHEGAEAMAQSALEFARVAGERLTEAKSLSEHGGWLSWLEANFKGNRLKAWRYMRIAEKWDEIANVSRVKHLSVRKALELLTETREPEEVEVIEPEILEPEPTLAKSYISKQIQAFGDKRLEKGFELGDVSRDAALLLGEIKKRGMAETYEALWEHDHRDAQVRKSEPQLKHLLSLNSKGNDDDVTVDLVSLAEGGGASSVFEAHKIRQAERAEAAKPKLSDADRDIADRAAQDLVGFEKQVDPNGLADMQRITLELSQTDGWEDLDADEKQRFIQTQAGDEHAATIKSSRPKPKPKYKNKAEFFEATARLRATDEDRAEFQELFGEAL